MSNLTNIVNHELEIRLDHAVSCPGYAMHLGIAAALDTPTPSPCELQDILEMGRWHGSLTAAVLADIELS